MEDIKTQNDTFTNLERLEELITYWPSVLRGRELRQFTEAGIPLVKLLADKFTELRGVMVSTGEVFSLISQRAVPFRMIEEIFNDMTDAGDIFYDMQKIQAQTVQGILRKARELIEG